MTSPSFEVYGRPNCGWCDKAKELLTEKGLSFQYHSTDDFETLNRLKTLVPGVKTVPQIFQNGTLIGGYEDLINHMTFDDDDEVMNQLSNGIKRITFTKLDKTIRTMRATRDMAIIGEYDQNAGANGQINVYDVDGKGWKSFRIENLISLEADAA